MYIFTYICPLWQVLSCNLRFYSHAQPRGTSPVLASPCQVGKVIGQKKAHIKEIQVNGGSTADKARISGEMDGSRASINWDVNVKYSFPKLHFLGVVECCEAGEAVLVFC